MVDRRLPTELAGQHIMLVQDKVIHKLLQQIGIQTCKYLPVCYSNNPDNGAFITGISRHCRKVGKMLGKMLEEKLIILFPFLIFKGLVMVTHLIQWLYGSISEAFDFSSFVRKYYVRKYRLFNFFLNHNF